ncbi:restriction endonuclease subunit S [Nitratireductor aquibiodomus]|uniref:restriction endonuclease subunit S n=1 Tax=Nitratireductor aquibiodomus TaxID=204799 RepID=UPI0019D35686|nr:restriction endonuclease subunit S [Nitratireductor aquibiodomus]MBN7761538.1 restriction endonuclease subunit S [Nitratireductor aquibiodomus]
MGDWQNCTLGDLVKFKGGSVFPKDAQGLTSGDLPFAKVSDMNASANWRSLAGAENWLSVDQARKLKATIHEPGAVAFAKIGIALTYNRRRQIVRPTLLDNNMMSAQSHSGKLDSSFLYYLLQTIDFNEVSAGSALPYLTIGALNQLSVAVPCVEEQRYIADLLGSLDDKIELNRQINKTLEAMAQAIFRDWFVDFGPTRRKIDGATDAMEIMGGLVSDPHRARELADLFPAKMGDGGLPEGWGEQPFSALLEDVIGGDWGKEAPEGDEVHPVSIIRGTDFPQILSGGAEKVPSRYTTTKKVERRRLQDLDILLEVSGGSPTQPTGRSILLTSSILERFEGDVVCASFCRRLRPHNLQTAMIAWAHLTCLYGEGGTWEYQNQSTGISNFQTTHFLGAEQIVWPGPAIAEMFASYVEPFVRSLTRNENLALAATRDLLLPKLMSGEIRLREAERKIEEVV